MRRSLLLATVAVGAAAVYLKQRSAVELRSAEDGTAEWAPLIPVGSAEVSGTADGEADPIEQDCPPGYPVKAKSASKIYHEPGGRSYDRTVPDRCFADTAAAEAAGFRPPKS